MSTPSDPGSSIPQKPPITPEEAAAQDAAAAAQAADAAQTDAIRELATEIAKQAVLDFDPATIRKGVITAIADTSAPPTISVQISGDTTTTIDGIRYITSYAPVVGDTALIIKQGTDLVALGNIAAAFSASAWTVVTLGAGFGHNGNGNGNVRYRKVWDNGSPKMQWKGAATRSSGTAVVSVPLASGYRPVERRSVIVARTAGGSNVVKLDFDTDGTVNMVGANTAPLSATPSDSVHNHGGHDHGIASSSHGHSVPTSNQQNIGSTSGTSNTHHHAGGAGQDASHTHDLDHTHAIGGTSSSAHNHGGTDATTPNDSTHNHGGHSHTVDDPVWIGFNIEYFLD